MKIPSTLVALLLCLPLAACGERPKTTDTAAETLLGQKIREGTDKARMELASSNISISDSGSSKAEITPAGDLLIEGKPVEIDAAQRELLLTYRGQILKVAEAGIDIGLQGADLGARAAKEAVKGIFSGKTGDIEKNIDADARRLETEAKKICDLLPPMRDTQQQLAATLPAFEPYARLEQSDIDDCRDKGKWSNK